MVSSVAFPLKVNILGSSLHFYGYQCSLAPKYFLLKNEHFWGVLFTCYGSQRYLAQKQHFGWFPSVFAVLFGSRLFPAVAKWFD